MEYEHDLFYYASLLSRSNFSPPSVSVLQPFFLTLPLLPALSLSNFFFFFSLSADEAEDREAGERLNTESVSDHPAECNCHFKAAATGRLQTLTQPPQKPQTLYVHTNTRINYNILYIQEKKFETHLLRRSLAHRENERRRESDIERDVQ